MKSRKEVGAYGLLDVHGNVLVQLLSASDSGNWHRGALM